jgi:hypothetical protein
MIKKKSKKLINKKSINKTLKSKILTKKNTNANANTNANTHTNDNIKIFSYNISWESMSGKIPTWELCNVKDDKLKNHPRHYSVCNNNISGVIENNASDFVLLQEATDYEKLLKQSSRLQKMKFIKHNSDLDVIITFWNSKKYKLLHILPGAFEKNRPWLATYFNNGLVVINVHFGHYSNEKEQYHLNNIISKIYDNINIINNNGHNKHNRSTGSNGSKKVKYEIKRIIIGGDFNFDIKTMGNQLKINNTIFYYHPKHILTCCIRRNKHYDHVIDTKSQPLDIIIPKVEYMASDHKPILVTLQK